MFLNCQYIHFLEMKRSQLQQQSTSFDKSLVEAKGIEPLSETISTGTSPGAVSD